MEADFYQKARQWYGTIYVSPACDRIKYFFLLILTVLCILQSIDVIKIANQKLKHKDSHILFVNHQETDSYIKINKIHFTKNYTLGLLELVVKKYVLNMETLTYQRNDNGMAAVQDKAIVIKNLSSSNVYKKYMEQSYENEDGDISLSILKLQKTVTIEKVEFLYGNLSIAERFYSLLFDIIPKGARVYFTTETTNKENKKQNVVATVFFSFHLDNEKQANSVIDFKVNDYFTEKINA